MRKEIKISKQGFFPNKNLIHDFHITQARECRTVNQYMLYLQP